LSLGIDWFSLELLLLEHHQLLQLGSIITSRECNLAFIQDDATQLFSFLNDRLVRDEIRRCSPVLTTTTGAYSTAFDGATPTCSIWPSRNDLK
jgi:hypothetical protein